MLTLKEAQDNWKATIAGDGGYCPCCDRWGKMYKRKINKTMARSLVWLSTAPTTIDGWVDVPNTGPVWVLRSNQLPTLRWWNLVERLAPHEEDDRKFSGLWRCTALGRRWVSRGARVPRDVWTYAGNVVRFDGPDVGLEDCLDETFSYTDTMNESLV